LRAKDERDVSRELAAPFSRRLRRLREAAGLTQEELAEKADLSAKGISDLERGERRRPYPHTVRALAEALELPKEERASLLATVPRRESFRAAATTASVSEYVLQVPSTPLVGRERELEVIKASLHRPEVRLLTLTGTGGVGKTRLALEAVRESAQHFPDGSVVVALASLSSPDLVIATVVWSLGLRETKSQSSHEVLSTYLRDKQLLLVLDNLEHVLAAAPEVAELMEVCPDLCVLVTSRAPLHLRGEHEYPVPPLTLPASTKSPEIEDVSNSASGRLFVERAKEASPTFELTAENAGAVASICRRLAGLPLALELAAAKATFLDPVTMLSRLEQALSTGWARDLPERQRTIRASLDWSYNLLDGPQQQLFGRLSVFSGGFTLEAAEAVGAAREEDGSGNVLDLLGRLVDQSLVVRSLTEGASRYGMLEPVRQYALERLEESGKAGEARRRHVQFFLALAEQAEPEIKGQDQVEWLDRLEADNGNMSAAIGRSLEAGDALTVARFGWALGMYWVMRLRQGEGRLWMEQVVSSSDLPAKMRGRIRWALSVCMYGFGDDRRLQRLAEEGVVLSREARDRFGEGLALGIHGFAALQLGELDQATRLLEESLEIFREQRDAWASAHVLNHLAVVPLRQEDYPRAVGYAEEALALTHRTGDRFAANISLNLLAQAAWASGEHRLADRYLREALVDAYEIRAWMDAAYCVQGLAAAAGERDEQQRAAQMLGAADAMLETAGPRFRAMATDDHELHRHTVSAVREQLGERAWTSAWDEGRAMTFDEAVAFALEGEPLPSKPWLP
jgi:predicted ATPase/DNA-binding XRE family transcriptional regulator